MIGAMLAARALGMLPAWTRFNCGCVAAIAGAALSTRRGSGTCCYDDDVNRDLCKSRQSAVARASSLRISLKKRSDGRQDACPSIFCRGLKSFARRLNRDQVLVLAAATQVEKNLRAAMRDALHIQDRSVAEPLFARTGRGRLKSRGRFHFANKSMCAA
jgi:hypothetical protein